jgi:hypothetical protein
MRGYLRNPTVIDQIVSLMRSGRSLVRGIFRQALDDMSGPFPGHHLGFVGLVSAVPLLDLLGTALFRSLAILRSDGIGINQFLSKRRFNGRKRCHEGYEPNSSHDKNFPVHSKEARTQI